MANVLDCDIVSDFKLQLQNYIHFRTNTLEKGINSFITPAIGWIVPLLFFYKNDFGIK